MRIAAFVGDFPLLSETFVLNQLTGLVARGHEVDVYAERPSGEAVQHPEAEALLGRTRYESMPPGRPARAAAAARLAARGPGRRRSLRALDPLAHGAYGRSLQLVFSLHSLAARDYDVVYAHFAANGVKAALLLELGALRGRLVTALHGVDLLLHPRLVGERAFARFVRRCDLFLPISARWNDELLRRGAPADRVVVHRMGVDLRRFAGPAPQREPHEPLRILTIGRLVEKKGIADGIRAVAALRREGIQVEYAVAGDGPLRGSLEQLVHELGVADAVTLLGPQPQPAVASRLAASHVLLAPSVTAADGDVEGLPVAVMEGMAAGLPVVATRHAAIPELVEDGVAGFVVEERDAAALSARLRTLAEDEALRRRLGAAARGRVAAQHDVDVLNDRLVELFETAIA